MSDNLICPACGSASTKKLIYTPQGGILWTPFLNFNKCRTCGVRFSGKTGEIDPQVPKVLRILSVIVILGFLGLLIGFALSFSSFKTAEPAPAATPRRIPTPQGR